jgi:putative flippase GtrA
LIYFLAVFVLRRLSRVGDVEASVVSHFIALVITYLGNHRYTFELAGGHIGYLSKFIACSLLGLVLNWAMFRTIVEYAWFPPIYGYVVVAIAIPIVNFLLYRFWAFNPQAGAE